jgi:hypothetical protein
VFSVAKGRPIGGGKYPSEFLHGLFVVVLFPLFVPFPVREAISPNPLETSTFPPRNLEMQNFFVERFLL